METKKNNFCRFQIDFFEFCFLVEACIPPRPIARSMFWEKVIDKHFYEMTHDERDRLYEWVCKNYTYQDGIKSKNEDCLLFQARFSPENQVVITTNYNGKEETHEAFVWGTRYYISTRKSIQEEYIVSVNSKLPPPGAHCEEA